VRKIGAVDDRARPQPRQRATLAYTRSRETRQALIRAALRLWDENDFDAAYEASTAADIALAAGVSKGTFYFHFANKEAIVVAMGSTTIEAMVDQVESGVGRGEPMHALGDQMMALMARRVVRGPKAVALRAAALGFPGPADELLAGSPRLTDAFESLLRYGQDRGELSRQVDVDEAAAMMTAVTMEAITRWGRGDRSARWLAQTLRNRVAVVFRGIGRTESS
jgi:AcrR family transcriptional regulator